jgi:hypothetical protein
VGRSTRTCQSSAGRLQNGRFCLERRCQILAFASRVLVNFLGRSFKFWLVFCRWKKISDAEISVFCGKRCNFFKNFIPFSSYFHPISSHFHPISSHFHPIFAKSPSSSDSLLLPVTFRQILIPQQSPFHRVDNSIF